MKQIYLRMSVAIIFMVIGLLVIGPAFAEKPPWAGGGKDKSEKGKGNPHDSDNKGNGKSEHKDYAKYDGKPHKYFDDHQRVVVHDYYAKQYGKSKKCPPGLAKKNNGCMPPGQAKKWAIGHPLPADVVYYPLPSSVVVQLGPPPPNHKYVRVAQDVLLLATGTGMVVDAIDNLNWEFKH